MNLLFDISEILGIIVVGSLGWFCVAIGWLSIRFGSNPNFIDHIIMFPLSVLEWYIDFLNRKK